MLNNLETKSRPLSGNQTNPAKRPRLSLNLHTMPQTVTGHWKKWLVLGFLILVIFAIGSFLLFTFTQ